MVKKSHFTRWLSGLVDNLDSRMRGGSGLRSCAISLCSSNMEQSREVPEGSERSGIGSIPPQSNSALRYKQGRMISQADFLISRHIGRDPVIAGINAM